MLLRINMKNKKKNEYKQFRESVKLSREEAVFMIFITLINK